MAVTIKDVAQLAGVSLGTASNVINGRRVRADLAEAVENAVATLGYKIDVRGKQLKTNVTNLLGVILPSAVAFAPLLEGIEKQAAQHGYRVVVAATENSAVREHEVALDLMRRKVDGLIVVTCLESYSLYSHRDIPPVVFAERRPVGLAADCVMIDDRQALRQLIDGLLAQGLRSFALVMEDLYQKLHYDVSEDFCALLAPYDPVVRIVDHSRGDAFCAACETLVARPDTEVIIATGAGQALGAKDAVALYGLEGSCHVVCLSNAEGGSFWRVSRPEIQAGERAASMLLAHIGEKNREEFEFESLFSALRPPRPKGPVAAAAQDGPVRFLMLDCPATRAAELLLPSFLKESGIEVELVRKNYNELREAMGVLNGKGDFDGGMVDLTWLAQLAEAGRLMPLPPGSYREELYLHALCREYGRYKGVQYGLPFMPGVTILFYRKDLFESPALQRKYVRQTGLPLEPPKNWTEYNKLARFFSRVGEADSPTEYGITAGTLLDGQVSTDFCMRNWSYGGSAFMHSRSPQGKKWYVTIDSPSSLVALKNYILSFEFTVPWHGDIRYEECVRDFLSGKAAMMTLFDSHADDLGRRTLARLPAEAGYAAVPGGRPVLGGWTLCIGKNSRLPQQALSFVNFICGEDKAFPFAVLSGSTAHKALYGEQELLLRFPWLPTVYQSYLTTRKRGAGQTNGDTIIRVSDYEGALAAGIRRVISGQLSPEEALRHIGAQLQALL